MTTWRLACSFGPASDAIWSAIEFFAGQVSQLTDGALTIQPVPGVADVPAAIGSGAAECGHTAGSFLLARDPVLALATFVPFGLDMRRHAAWLDGPGAAIAGAAWARQGLVALPCLNTGAQMGGWFRQPIRAAADLAGLRIRTAGLPALVFERLGAVPTSPAMADILPALRAGTLDAADWIGPHDDLRMRFYEAAPFYHFPGAMEPSAQLSLIVGRDRWDGLPCRQRAALRCAASAVERALLIRYDTLNPPALAQLLDRGVTLCAFPDEVLQAMRGATAQVLETLSATDASFAEALASYQGFAAAGRHWWRIGERDAAAAAS